MVAPLAGGLKKRRGWLRDEGGFKENFHEKEIYISDLNKPLYPDGVLGDFRAQFHHKSPWINCKALIHV